MKCRIGDRIRFLNDVGDGTITRIIDSKTVSVLNEDGFEIPVLESEVIIIDSLSDQTIKSRLPEPEKNGSNDTIILKKGSTNTPVIEESTQSEIHEQEVLISFLERGEVSDSDDEHIGLFIAFVPVNQLNSTESDQGLYIINDSTYRILFSVSCWNKQQNKVVPFDAGFLHPDSKELLKTFTKKELNSPLALNIQALFFKNIPFTAQQPEFFDIEINPVKFFRPGSFTENDFFEENAMVFTIADSEKDQLIKSLSDKAINESISQKDVPIKPEPKKEEPEIVEVDLHIEQLVDSHVGLQAGEIIEIQLARFVTALETGIRSKSTRKMVFIHGLGNGKLKNEVIKKLERDYPKFKYQDASFKEYGFGATMVFLKK